MIFLELFAAGWRAEQGALVAPAVNVAIALWAWRRTVTR